MKGLRGRSGVHAMRARGAERSTVSLDSPVLLSARADQGAGRFATHQAYRPVAVERSPSERTLR
jgi:hypothetical protein